MIKYILLACIFSFPVYADEQVAPPVEVKVEKTTRDIINQYDWDKDLAYAVMMAESSGQADVVNWKDKHNGCNGSYGLFQIACVHETNPELLKDEEYNVKRAYELYKKSGWKIWGAYTSKAYLKHLS